MSALDQLNAMAIAELKQQIARLGNVQGGPGIAVHRGPGGMVINARPAKQGPALPPSYAGGTVLVLDSTNPTVTWTRGTDRCPVSYGGPRIEYNAVSHKLVRHYRVEEFDRGGNLRSIGAELSEDIVEFKACP